VFNCQRRNSVEVGGGGAFDCQRRNSVEVGGIDEEFHREAQQSPVRLRSYSL
jgi:hypothetical protein